MNRKRITKSHIETNINNKKNISDDLAYVENNASVQARNLSTNDIGFTITVYGDKHYILRCSTPDDSGITRKGISVKDTVALVFKSVKHIIYYIFKGIGFNPINFPSSFERNKRIVLIDIVESELPLNLVVEIHFEDIDTYEFTILTALKVNDFKLSDGQFAIRFTQNSSELLRLVKKNLTLIDKYNN